MSRPTAASEQPPDPTLLRDNNPPVTYSQTTISMVLAGFMLQVASFFPSSDVRTYLLAFGIVIFVSSIAWVLSTRKA